jgi:2,5-diketo-D-gluconate reductase A
LWGEGRLRTAGVSNFHHAHLDRIVAETGVVPAVNQIEVHPYLRNDAARSACARRGVAIEAWSPLGMGQVLGDVVVTAVAAARARTSAQVVLRWHLQHGHVVIPKSVHRERMEENLAVFDFELSAEEMASIDALDRKETES